jgi:ABC-type phosphate/phosphonate transport system permease subunit
VSYILHHPEELAWRLLQHLEITVLALAIAFAIALPLGVLGARNDRVRGPLLASLGVIYTLPSLAIFALLIPAFGLGLVTTEIALIAYAQMILVRSIVVGLRGVPPAMREAALGLGMTTWQSLYRVEFPQALPVVIGGLRHNLNRHPRRQNRRRRPRRPPFRRPRQRRPQPNNRRQRRRRPPRDHCRRRAPRHRTIRDVARARLTAVF